MGSIYQKKIGLLGGGQLGRMLIQEALNWDLDIHIMDASTEMPCGPLAHSFTCGDIKNYDDVMAFGKDLDVLSIEMENVNTDALEDLVKQGVAVFPQPQILKTIKDKGIQKEFYAQHKIPTSDFYLVADKAELLQHPNLEFPCVQKMRVGGYDGKGVQILKSEKDLDLAFDAPSVIEKMEPIAKELAVSVARNAKGEMVVYPVVECEFSPTNNLVEFLFSPAEISEEIELKAKQIAQDIALKLDLVGILAIEYFLNADGSLMVNEMAPRTHNSGHHTIEGNYTSQFEQHLRAVCNLPLGNPNNIKPAAMINVLGEAGFTGNTKVEGFEELLSFPNVYFHHYGKKQTTDYRKMGHITLLAADIPSLKEKAQKIKNILKIKA